MMSTETGTDAYAEQSPSAEELAALQLERLQATLHHAYDNVEHYRRKFDAAGVRPEDCRSLADLARFPFTTKADLRETYPYGMFAVPMSQVRRIHASSGTTGRPTVVGYTENDISMWADVVARSIRAAGGRRATRCTSPTATACSPAVSEPTTAPSARAARSSPHPAARQRARYS
jgi:phenylacetate-coenzyme A ligase PaaK-like adenylate-forming protein